MQLFIKHSLDRLTALCLAVICMPLLVLIAVAVKIEDGGPVFFRQTRLGLHGREFKIVKFRTMRDDADDLLDVDGRVHTGRVTRIGRILRFLSVDELPQLANILVGDMSFIGPRPVLVEHWGRYTKRQRGRFAMRPGITGLAQVAGRNTLPWSKRLDLDLQYIADFSLWLDFRIVLRTIRVVALGEGIVLDRNPEQVDDLPRTTADDGRDN